MTMPRQVQLPNTAVVALVVAIISWSQPGFGADTVTPEPVPQPVSASGEGLPLHQLSCSQINVRYGNLLNQLAAMEPKRPSRIGRMARGAAFRAMGAAGNIVEGAAVRTASFVTAPVGGIGGAVVSKAVDAGAAITSGTVAIGAAAANGAIEAAGQSDNSPSLGQAATREALIGAASSMLRELAVLHLQKGCEAPLPQARR